MVPPMMQRRFHVAFVTLEQHLMGGVGHRMEPRSASRRGNNYYKKKMLFVARALSSKKGIQGLLIKALALTRLYLH